MSDTAREPEALPPTITAWQCIGCGKLEAPQNCIGVCQDRKVELVSAMGRPEREHRSAQREGASVSAHDYAEAAHARDAARERIAALEALVAKLAHVTPRADAWEATYRALQADARGLLAPGAPRAR